MKKLEIIYCLAVLIGMTACNRHNNDTNKDNMAPIENKFNSANEAFEQTKKNLPLLLSEDRRKAFGIGSDEDIKNLITRVELPVSYLSMDQLKDSILSFSDEGYLYFLGDKSNSKICIGVVKGPNGWIQSTIGLKNYVNAINRLSNTKRLIDVPGLEISFIEITDSTGNSVYRAVTDYSDAKITRGISYSKKEMLTTLNRYRTSLESKYGKDFMNGNLEK